MLEATWLTFQLYRFEVGFTTAVTAGAAIGAWILAQHLRAVSVEPHCFKNFVVDNDGDVLGPCGDALGQFFAIQGGEYGHVRMGLIVAAPLVGLVLGVPIVARELELRTASIAWSLDARRRRWLVERFLPMLATGLLGLAVVAWLGDEVVRAATPPGDLDWLTVLHMRGAPLVTRGRAILAVALLVGSLVGRTLPAFLLAASGLNRPTPTTPTAK
jgi:hypothetical protein